MKKNLFIKLCRSFVGIVQIIYIIVISATAVYYLQRAFHLDPLDYNILRSSVVILDLSIIYRLLRDMIGGIS
jgi:Kef-type K+ transport system membrane component KefB